VKEAAGVPLDVAVTGERTRVALRVSHPKGNSLTSAMMRALIDALDALAETSDLKLVTLEAAGPDFSFGANIPEHAPDRIADALPLMHRAIGALLGAPAPTAAIVRGRCLGGGFELALACDFILASDDATFALPEIALGVFPPAAAVLLPWRVGGARAARAVLTGEILRAADWRACGLIEVLGPAGQLPEQVDAWFARHLAPRSASSLRHAAVAARLPLVAHLCATLPDLERLYLDSLMRTADAAEGIAAFMEKRAPRWQNR
jgi:cyclohexa-1,5-dienecarbonyl-CoA hydratase